MANEHKTCDLKSMEHDLKVRLKRLDTLTSDLKYAIEQAVSTLRWLVPDKCCCDLDVGFVCDSCIARSAATRLERAVEKVSNNHLRNAPQGQSLQEIDDEQG